MAEVGDGVTRTYHLVGLRRQLFYVIAGVIAVTGLLLGVFFLWVVAELGLDLLGMIVVALPLVLFGGIALAVVWFARSTRLELSDRGIALRLPGAVVEGEWDDVETIAPALWGPLTGDALHLRRPPRTRHSWWFPFLFTRNEFAIPVAPFALPLRGSRLEADLRSRVPELFEMTVGSSGPT